VGSEGRAGNKAIQSFKVIFEGHDDNILAFGRSNF